VILGTAKAPLHLVADASAREALLATQPDAALVAESLPMRANLSMLENIALVAQFRRGLSFDAAAALVEGLLVRAGYADSALRRDPDLDREERFVAKFLRAALMAAPIIVVDRPALLLPDIPPAPFIDRLLTRLADDYDTCWIVDYAWNASLYARLPD